MSESRSSLILEPVSDRVSKGAVLAWILNTELVKKNQVGVIDIRGRQALVEVPASAGPRLVKRLDGQKLRGRRVQVWHIGGPVQEAVDVHFKKLARWLDMESRAEAEQAREWREKSAAGDSSTGLAGLVVRSEDSGLGGFLLLSLGRQNPMQKLPATRLTVGSPIQLSNGGKPVRGVITSLDSTLVEVAVARVPSSDSDDRPFRIDAAEDEISMGRSRTALSRAQHATGDRLTELRDVLLGLQEPGFEATPSLTFLDAQLNQGQQEAIAFCLSAQDVAVLHGPPGTGKTRTLVELIRQAVRRGEKVLACAPSNLGVDNLFERLLAAGEKAIRLGHPIRVLPTLRDRTLGALARIHPDVKPIKKWRREANDLFKKADRADDRTERRDLRDEAKEILDQARSAEADIVQDLISDADVICATNTGLDAQLMGSRRFDLAVIDEACQSTEPACWIPLLRADRVVLAGDHCQLPPTVMSMAAAKEGFNVSLQERLVDRFGDSITHALQTQYRMHEAIMAYSSATFYADQLNAHESVAGHLLCDLPEVIREELTETALHYIDTSGAGYEEEREAAGASLRNPEEARLAAKKARDLIALGIAPTDIAVITPYAAQVQAIRDCLGDETVEVGTIDGFQGREKEAVIISLVRSNAEKKIGFLSDVRRMNVALTRARRKLIVIGDSSTITAHTFYEDLLEYMDLYEAYHVVWEEE